MTALRIALAGLLVVSLAACDSSPAPLTARAVAAVMLDHLPDDTSTREAAHVSEESPAGLVGAQLWYPEGDGGARHVTVEVRSGGDPYDAGCGEDPERCVRLDDDTVLRWSQAQVESDPGVVVVSHRRGDEVVTVLSSGPEITGDPRELGLDPDIEELTALAHDDRLRLTTTEDVVEAGEEVGDWKGGEVDPDELAVVTNNDRTVAMTWLAHQSAIWQGPSPYKDLLGPDAVGGRVRVHLMHHGRVTIDALAAPEPPEWLGTTCRPAGYRCNEFAGFHFVWRPERGDQRGDAFLWLVREDGETVGYHYRGRRLIDHLQYAAETARFYSLGRSLEEGAATWPLSYTTSRRRFEEFVGPIGEEPPQVG